MSPQQRLGKTPMQDHDTIAAFNAESTAAETKSSAFYGNLVPLDDLSLALAQFIEAGNKLDKMKKSLFYGRAYESFRTEMGYVEHPLKCEDLPETVFPGFESQGRDIIHAIIGKATEAVELCELLETSIQSHQPVDQVGYVEEIGDSRWYDRIGLPAVGITCREADQGNYRKLSAKAAAQARTHARYAEGFSEKEAIVRDIPAERAGLEATMQARGVWPFPKANIQR
jgi:hypothetical protein